MGRMLVHEWQKGWGLPPFWNERVIRDREGPGLRHGRSGRKVLPVISHRGHRR
ncbi:hypothetical protein ASZ90_016668 [hydrocarbon metagenome]|uniref:Uncharacterized protein n=1 Tax=hydrocarbon metagenome TaxID=938273 RepID=A0A0W8EK76_9ZZZZ